MKLCARADVPKTTLALLDPFKSELVALEPPRSVKVPGGKLGNGMALLNGPDTNIASWSAGRMDVLTAGGAKSHRVTRALSDHHRLATPRRHHLEAEWLFDVERQ